MTEPARGLSTAGRQHSDGGIEWGNRGQSQSGRQAKNQVCSGSKCEGSVLMQVGQLFAPRGHVFGLDQ